MHASCPGVPAKGAESISPFSTSETRAAPKVQPEKSDVGYMKTYGALKARKPGGFVYDLAGDAVRTFKKSMIRPKSPNLDATGISKSTPTWSSPPTLVSAAEGVSGFLLVKLYIGGGGTGRSRKQGCFLNVFRQSRRPWASSTTTT